MKPHLILALCLAVMSCMARGQAVSPEQLATETRIPRLEFREATVQEAVDFLRKKAKDLLAPGQVFNINYVRQADEEDARISCYMLDAPIMETLKLVAFQADLTLSASDTGLYLHRKAELPPETNGLREIGWSARKTQVRDTAIYLTGRKDACTEAQKLIEDAFGDRFKTPKEVRDVLDVLKKHVEEAEKRIQELLKVTKKEESERLPPPL